MITLNQLTYDIREVLRGGNLVSDDDPVSLRQVAYWVRIARAVLLRQQISKGQTLSDNVVQVIPCVDVEQIDTSYDPNTKAECYIVRTVNKLPTPIEAYHDDLILRVSTPNLGAIPFTWLPDAAIPYSGYNKFGKNMVKAFLVNGYIVLKNTPYIEKISVTMVAADPEELAHFNDCTGEACFTWDSAYPISDHMAETIKKMIIDTNFRYTLQPLNDPTNDAATQIQGPK